MRILVSVNGTIKPYKFEIEAKEGKVFSVKHLLGEIKCKIAKLNGKHALIQTNKEMCKSDGTRVRLGEWFKSFDWDMNSPLYFATPTMDYGIIVGLTVTDEV